MPSVELHEANEDWKLDKLKQGCKNLRNEAFVETSFKSLGLRIRDVLFDEHVALILISEKRAGPRRMRLANAKSLLANWIEDLHQDLKERHSAWISVMGRRAGHQDVGRNVPEHLNEEASDFRKFVVPSLAMKAVEAKPVSLGNKIDLP